MRSCWTQDGVIVLKAFDGSKHKVSSMDELSPLLVKFPKAQDPKAQGAGDSLQNRTDSYYLREIQYQKLLQNIFMKQEQKYTKKSERRNTGCTDKDICEDLVRELERQLRVKSKSSVPKVPLMLESESHTLYGHVSKVKGSSSYAPVTPTMFTQRSFFPSQKWGRSTHKTRNFKKVTHCIFDMDGTIIDSETQYHKILKELCVKHGKKYTRELEFKNFGATDKQICENVVNDLQLNMSAADLENELKVVTKIRLPKAPLKKGMERFLNHLSRSGVLFALATNSTRRDVRLHIASKPKIFGMFHHMVCAGDPDVDRGKPFPDLYLIAAAKFPDKPPPVKCLVFEDSLVGLEAGLAAGMQVIMTPPRSLPLRECAAATLVLKSVLDFKPEDFGLPPFTDKVINKHKPKFSKS